MTGLMPAGALPRGASSAAQWFERNTFSSDGLTLGHKLIDRKRSAGTKLSVAILALDNEDEIRRGLKPFVETAGGLIDQLVVVDGGSTDGTELAAREAGATVVATQRLLPSIPATPGRGESMWRSLSCLTGDVVVWLSAETAADSPSALERLAAPILTNSHVVFTQAAYVPVPAGTGTSVPFRTDEALLVRPLLALLFPELGGFVSPLSADCAGRRTVLNAIPFVNGPSATVAMLIGLLEAGGLDGMSQVLLDGPGPAGGCSPHEAASIARTIMRKAQEAKRLRYSADVPNAPLLVPKGKNLDVRLPDEVERLPMDLVPMYLEALGHAAGDHHKREPNYAAMMRVARAL